MERTLLESAPLEQVVPVESLSLNFEIIRLGSEHAWKVAPLAQEHIALALEYAYRETDYFALRSHMKKGDVQLWVVWDKDNRKVLGSATTMLVKYDLCHSVRIVTLAGDHFSSWKVQMLERIASFAQEQGATRIEATGRRGWARVLQPLGFETAYVTYIKEL